MTGRRQSSAEHIFEQILIKKLKYKKGKSYPIGKQYNRILSRPIPKTGDFYANCLWNLYNQRSMEIDFCFPHDKLAIEIDGEFHRSSLPQIKKDIERNQIFKQIRWTLIRIPDTCVHNTFRPLLD